MSYMLLNKRQSQLRMQCYVDTHWKPALSKRKQRRNRLGIRKRERGEDMGLEERGKTVVGMQN